MDCAHEDRSKTCLPSAHSADNDVWSLQCPLSIHMVEYLPEAKLTSKMCYVTMSPPFKAPMLRPQVCVSSVCWVQCVSCSFTSHHKSYRLLSGLVTDCHLCLLLCSAYLVPVDHVVLNKGVLGKLKGRSPWYLE